MNNDGYSNSITHALALLLSNTYWDEKYSLDADFCYLLDNALEQKSFEAAKALTEYIADDFSRKVYYYFDDDYLRYLDSQERLKGQTFYSLAKLCYFHCQDEIQWLEIVVRATNIEINDLKY